MKKKIYTPEEYNSYAQPKPWLKQFQFVDEFKDHQLLLNPDTMQHCIVHRKDLTPAYYASCDQAFTVFLQLQISEF